MSDVARFPSLANLGRQFRQLEEAEVTARMERVAEELNRRVRSCHERFSCPSCGAPVGEECRRMPLGYPDGAKLLRPHRTRWQQETPAR